MKPINKNKLLQASRNYRNDQETIRLAQIDSLREWSKTPAMELPKYKKPKVKKYSVGWQNFVKLVLQLKP